MDSVELATAYLHLVPSLQGAESQIAGELNGVGNAAGAAAGVQFGAAFKGALGAAAIGAAVVAGFAGLYKVGSVFDDVGDTIRIQTGESGVALQRLVDVATDVGTAVPTSFEAAGDTVARLNQRLDLSSETLTTVASQYLEAGRILEQDVDINATTAAFAAFHVEGDEVIDGMDTLFRVSQATGVGMNELASAVQQNAPALQNLGFSFEETVSLVGSLDKAGLNSTQTLAAMGKGLVALAKDGEEPQAAFRRVTDEIQTLITNGDIAGAIDLASGIFGTRAANQFVGAVQSGTLALDDLVAGVGASSDTILGVAAETADFGESWTIVKNNALAALEPIGTAIFNGVGGAMQKVAALSQTVGPAIAGAFSSAGSLLGPMFAQLGPIFSSLLPQLLALWQAFSPVSLILKAISPLLPQLTAVFTQLASTIGGSLVTVLSSLMSALSPVITALTGTLSGILATLLPVFAQLAQTIAGALGQALVTLAPILGEIATALGETLGTVLVAVSPLIEMLAQLFGQILAAVLPLLSPILGLVAALLPLLAPILTLVGQLLTPLIQLLTALLTPILALISPLVDLLAGAVGVIIEKLAGLIEGVVTVITWFVNLATGSKQAQGQLVSVWSAVGAFFAGIWNNIVGAFRTGISNALNLVNSLRSTILNALAGAGNWLLDVGRNIVQGLINGVGAMVSQAVQAVINVGTAMLNGAKAALGIHSPSTVFADEVGEEIPGGIGVGVDRGRASLQSKIDSLVDVPDISALAPIASATMSAALGADDGRGLGRAEGGGVVINGDVTTADPAEFWEWYETKKRRALALAGLQGAVIS